MIAAREADEIIRKLSFKSFEADYKTMLIWLPEAMNEEAANKILKILEEPWDKHAFHRWSAKHPDRLLPTIVSRTQEVGRAAHRARRAGAWWRSSGAWPIRLQARNMARLAGGDLLELGNVWWRARAMTDAQGAFRPFLQRSCG